MYLYLINKSVRERQHLNVCVREREREKARKRGRGGHASIVSLCHKCRQVGRYNCVDFSQIATDCRSEACWEAS